MQGRANGRFDAAANAVVRKDQSVWIFPRNGLHNFDALRVLSEDRVAPKNGFPFRTHCDAGIFSYILTGELTHRDSMTGNGATGSSKDQFYRIRRGDEQFTTGGTGISHSEENEHANETVHFLQIWALPWMNGVKPQCHDMAGERAGMTISRLSMLLVLLSLHIEENKKKEGFVTIISPHEAGKQASPAQEQAAIPAVTNTIPIHADMPMGAPIIAALSDTSFLCS